MPLGIAARETCAEIELKLAPGETLTFLSDGVVEARSATGELFGFAPTEEVSARPPALIAETAQKFGQDDDMTVFSLTRAYAN